MLPMAVAAKMIDFMGAPIGSLRKGLRSYSINATDNHSHSYEIVLSHVGKGAGAESGRRPHGDENKDWEGSDGPY